MEWMRPILTVFGLGKREAESRRSFDDSDSDETVIVVDGSCVDTRTPRGVDRSTTRLRRTSTRPRLPHRLHLWPYITVTLVLPSSLLSRHGRTLHLWFITDYRCRRLPVTSANDDKLRSDTPAPLWSYDHIALYRFDYYYYYYRRCGTVEPHCDSRLYRQQSSIPSLWMYKSYTRRLNQQS